MIDHGFEGVPAKGRSKGLLAVSHGIMLRPDGPPSAELLDLFRGYRPPNIAKAAAAPYVGVTGDGVVKDGLYSVQDDGFDPHPAVRAARELLDLVPDAAGSAQFPVDADEWRRWTNAFPLEGSQPHGLQLQGATEDQRSAAMAVVEASLSSGGSALVRDTMRLNEWLGEYLQDYTDSLTRWCYWFAVFGDPDAEGPWGWQLWGHHLNVSCFVLGGQVVLTPMFVGAEPTFAPDGTRILDREREAGFDLLESLSANQRKRAVLHPSIRVADLPHELGGPIDGRHLGGAGADNAIIPAAGLRGDSLTPGQREALLALADPYLSRMQAGPHAAKRAAVERHLDESWFAWIGSGDRDQACYYRLFSPVVLIEYDNHSGIFLDNDEAEPFHVHTIVRTPNGGDYGRDLLQQHYRQEHRA